MLAGCRNSRRSPGSDAARCCGLCGCAAGAGSGAELPAADRWWWHSVPGTPRLPLALGNSCAQTHLAPNPNSKRCFNTELEAELANRSLSLMRLLQTWIWLLWSFSALAVFPHRILAPLSLMSKCFIQICFVELGIIAAWCWAPR